MLKDKASEYYRQGYSCSESVVMSAIDAGLCGKELLACATPFSGGMMSGCLCGAVAGAQLVIGYNTGRDNVKGNEVIARKLAASVVDEFKKRNKVTCCKVLTMGLEGQLRKEHCVKMVEDGADILENLLTVKV